MKLWLISPKSGKLKSSYDYYAEAVVASKTEEGAKNMHPSGEQDDWKESYGVWVTHPEYVDAVLIGTAVKGTKEGTVIISNFIGA